MRTRYFGGRYSLIDIVGDVLFDQIGPASGVDILRRSIFLYYGLLAGRGSSYYRIFAKEHLEKLPHPFRCGIKLGAVRSVGFDDGADGFL